MEKTNNLKLNVWEKTDPIHAKDFNDNFQTLDSAVGSLQGEHIYVGSYVGDGKNSRTIDLPWEPKFAVVFGFLQTRTAIQFLTTTDSRYITNDGCSSGSTYSVTLKGNHLVVNSADWFNQSGKQMQYICFR